MVAHRRTIQYIAQWRIHIMKRTHSQLPIGLVRDSLEIPFFQQARKMFDQFFDSNFADLSPCKSIDTNLYPRCDIIQFNDRLQLELQIPGLSKDQISINLTDDVLTISGEKRQSVQNKKNGDYIRREIKRSKFTRSFNVSNVQLNLDMINAKFQNNVLLISIPKKVEQKQISTVKTIQIQ